MIPVVITTVTRTNPVRRLAKAALFLTLKQNDAIIAGTIANPMLVTLMNTDSMSLSRNANPTPETENIIMNILVIFMRYLSSVSLFDLFQ